MKQQSNEATNQFKIGETVYTVKITRGFDKRQFATVIKENDLDHPLVGTTFREKEPIEDIMDWAQKCVAINFNYTNEATKELVNDIFTDRTKGEWKARKTLKNDLPFEIYNTSDNCTLALITNLTKTGNAKANAEFICKAVNEYDKLKADKDALYKALKNLLQSYRADFHNITGGDLNDTEAVKQAKDAIKQVEIK